MRNKSTVIPAIDWVGHRTRNKTKHSLCWVIVHGDTGHRLGGTQDEEQDETLTVQGRSAR